MDPDRSRLIADWLGAFLAPGQTFELKALQLPNRRALHAFYASSQTAEAAAQALRWEALGAKGVQFSLNPLRSDIGSGRAFASNDDVLEWRWVLVDVEHRQHDLAATEEEKVQAWAVADRVLGTFEAAGIQGHAIADSGNGWHLLVPVDWADVQAGKDRAKALLAGLSERCSDEQARVDPSTYQPCQGCRCYGTLKRKGEHTEERPHRHSRLCLPGDPSDEIRQANSRAIERLLDLWRRQDELRRGPARSPLDEAQREAERSRLYAQAALKKESEKVATATPGSRVRTLFAAACALGGLVAGGLLSRLEVEDALRSAAVACGLDQDPECGPAGIASNIARGLERGAKTPRTAPESNGRPAVATAVVPPVQQSPPPEVRIEAADVAMIDDLIRAGAEISWLWPGWIQIGVLTVLAAEGGTGKTRLCADLLRRIVHGLPWPDGAPMTLPPESLALWVMADNHHDEMVSLAQAFRVVPAIRINAHRADPYGGVMLDTPEDLAAFAGRIEAVRPAIVVVDTVGNATDRNLARQEDAKAYYQPLQQIARKSRVAMICVTHLNAQGGVLGRRALEKVRVALRMERPDESQPDRRRLEVLKSNSKYPPVLGVTMGDHGNEYDTSPPARADRPGGGTRGPVPQKAIEAADWLASRLALGPARVSVIRRESEAEEISPPSLYRAKDDVLKGQVEEYEIDGKKWWRMTQREEEV